MKEYNGHRSWNAWNVALWISNDEKLYRIAMDCLARPPRTAARAADYFMENFKGGRTPDGAKYNHLAVQLCLQGFVDDA